jgi:Uma2 family endonuclease
MATDLETLHYSRILNVRRSGGPRGGRKVYDRSSFEGDFLVAIPGQTAEDFEEYAPESQFCEYFDGVIYMPTPVTDRHQDWTIFLCDLVNGFRLARGLGQVLTGPAVLRLTPEHKPEPDLFARPVGGAVEGGPKAVFVVEVLSPSNRAYDLHHKAAIYQSAGIPEIWYVDGEGPSVIVDRREEGGYRREAYSEGVAHSTGLPGFWIDAGWLWPDPLPNPRECLELILAGPPA